LDGHSLTCGDLLSQPTDLCSQSGSIDYDEFFEFIDERKTPFSEGLFRLIDADSNGTVRDLRIATVNGNTDAIVLDAQIDFEEFVHATVMYCMYTRDEILQCEYRAVEMSMAQCLPHTAFWLHSPVAFDTFDPGKTGGIGEKEFKRLISLVNDGKPAFPGNFKSALAEFDR
jgi:hypothetical protein